YQQFTSVFHRIRLGLLVDIYHRREHEELSLLFPYFYFAISHLESRRQFPSARVSNEQQTSLCLHFGHQVHWKQMYQHEYLFHSGQLRPLPLLVAQRQSLSTYGSDRRTRFQERVGHGVRHFQISTWN